MTSFDRFDPFARRITDAIEEIAETRLPVYIDDVLRQTARTSQRPRWTFPERWLPLGLTARHGVLGDGIALRPLFLLALIAMLGTGALVAGLARNQQPIVPPALRGAFAPAGSLPAPGTIALLRPDGQILIFGGRAAAEGGLGSLGSAPESIFLYDPASGVSREIGTTPTSVSFAVALADGRVLAIGLAPSGFGGGSGGDSNASLIDLGAARVVALGPTSQRHLHGAGVRLADGRILLVGGAAGTTEAELFDPATGRFKATGSTSAPMMQPSATLLTDGRVLVVGEREATAELYDPATGTFSRTAAMSTPREGFTATLLRDGRVLIAGGWATSGTVVDGVFVPSEPARLGSTAEIFDPGTGLFTQVGPMVTPRVHHFAVALADGRVLVGGGTSSTRADVGSGGVVEPVALVAELFDPATGRFGETGALTQPRFGAGAVLLLDGRVLVVGSVLPSGSGITTDPFAASSMEIFE